MFPGQLLVWHLAPDLGSGPALTGQQNVGPSVCFASSLLRLANLVTWYVSNFDR